MLSLDKLSIIMILGLQLPACVAEPKQRSVAPAPSPTIQPVQPSPSPNPTQPVADCVDAEPYICDAEKELLRLTNELRAQQGLPSLRLDPKLSYAARDWSAQQARSGRIGHEGFGNGERLFVMRQRFPNQPLPTMSRENVAMMSVGRNRSDSQFVRGFINMWANSSGHRTNILSRTSAIGIGIHISANGAAYATQIFGN